jgi:hypothetical protein
VTVDEITDFFNAPAKRLPALPQWREVGSRDGERRARLPIEVNGRLAHPELEITVRTTRPNDLIIVLLTPDCVTRLCIGNGHRNKLTGETVTVPHFHRWADNSHLRARLRQTLPFAVQTACIRAMLHSLGFCPK